ncbi:MAG: hypothetical protein A2V90_06675 [Gammaproteobacteria bacterium RBG_16_57_12]|nr:MAG: hypothetical protein A2V90_06675 [Gammaproteobacteria bacterium RBG_16_57_12]
MLFKLAKHADNSWQCLPQRFNVVRQMLKEFHLYGYEPVANFLAWSCPFFTQNAVRHGDVQCTNLIDVGEVNKQGGII